MCVWQSQAPAGTSKFTVADGCEALAKLVRVRMEIPAAIAPSRTSRRVSMDSSRVPPFSPLGIERRGAAREGDARIVHSQPPQAERLARVPQAEHEVEEFEQPEARARAAVA